MKSQREEEMEKSMADLGTVLSETQRSLNDTQAELSVTRTSLDELHASSAGDVQRLEEELSTLKNTSEQEVERLRQQNLRNLG